MMFHYELSPQSAPFPARYDHRTERWVTVEDIEFRDGDLKVFIPKGFTFDGASVPRVMWGWLPPQGRYLRAACVHDYMYHSMIWSRQLADKTFRRIMKLDDVWFGRRWLMWTGVRTGGWVTWLRRKRKNG